MASKATIVGKVRQAARQAGRILVHRLQSKFGYTVMVRTELGNVFVHTTWTLAEALEWMACYSTTDLVRIWQENRKSAKRVAQRTPQRTKGLKD